MKTKAKNQREYWKIHFFHKRELIVERENTFVHLNVHPKKQKINGHVCKRKIDDTHEGATEKEKRVKEKK